MVAKLKTSKSSPPPTWVDEDWLIKVKKKLSTKSKKLHIDCANMREKLFSWQKDRIKHNKITHADITSRGLKNFVEAVARDKALRSNIVGELLEIQDQVDYFKDTLSITRRRIRGRHGSELKRLYGAVASQNDAMEDYFIVVIRAIKDGESVQRLANLVISDIDQGAFSDNRLLESGKLIFHPGRSD